MRQLQPLATRGIAAVPRERPHQSRSRALRAALPVVQALSLAALLGLASAQSPTDPQSVAKWRQADAIQCDRREVCHGPFCERICVPGTVRPDIWAAQALHFQRWLQLDRPLFEYELVGTHNGAISQAYGYGVEERQLEALLAPLYPNKSTVTIANQRISLTDQLNLGVRHIELDIYFFDGVDPDVRICHWPVCPADFWVIARDAARRQGLPEPSWDLCNELACAPLPALREHLREIRAWLDAPANAAELLVLYLDNKNVEAAHGARVLEVFAEAFGGDEMPLVFTPHDKATLFGGAWPSPRQLLAKGKRVVVENNRASWVDEPTLDRWVFSPTLWKGTQTAPSGIEEFAGCELRGSFRWRTNYTRSLDSSLILGPASSLWGTGKRDYPPSRMHGLTKCSVTEQAMDQISPAHMGNFVWSWARDHAPDGARPGRDALRGAAEQAKSCVLLGGTDARDGRWRNVDCEELHHFACVAEDDEASWTVSGTAGPGDRPSAGCPAGFVPGLPTAGYLNELVAVLANSDAAGSSRGLWIDFSRDLLRLRREY